MKGFLIAYVLLFGIIFSSRAQARIAIVGGVHQSTVLQTSNQPGFSDIKKGYLPRTGFNIGFIGDIPLGPKSNFSFQPGIEFFNKGRKFSQSSIIDSGIYQTNNTQYVDYIDVPVNIVYQIVLGRKSAIIIGGGPYISFFYSGKETSTTLGPNNYYQAASNSNLPVGNGPGKYTTYAYGVNALAGR